MPCGEPKWLVLASGAPGGATVLAGGPKGLAAVRADDGAVRWGVALDGPTLAPAIARGRVFLTTAGGRVFGYWGGWSVSHATSGT